MYIYTHIHICVRFLFIFHSSRFLFSLDLPTANLYSSCGAVSLRCFFNVKTLGSVPLALLFHLFSLCRSTSFRSKSDFTFVCACVRVHVCMCMCARVFVLLRFSPINTSNNVWFRSAVNFFQRLAARSYPFVFARI